MQFPLALAILSSFNLVSMKDIAVVDCTSDQFCQAMPYADQSGVFTKCRESDKGNLESRKVCVFSFVTDPANNFNRTVMNPAPGRCQDRMTPISIANCNKYVETNSPYTYVYKGKRGFTCFTNPQPYLCTVAGKNYIACALQGRPCENPCRNPSN